jgi:predicted nicotinamide N-methyase
MPISQLSLLTVFRKCQGISDDLMSRLSVLLSSSLPSEAVAVQQKSYVTYTLSSLFDSSASPPMITLLESRNLLAAAGTTGFRTWDACLHLGSYLSSPKCSVPIANKTILELGAGTGYLSILCAKYLGASHVTATDGADTVVSEMGTNFYLNELQDESRITAKELQWGYPLLGGEQIEWNSGRKIDVVLGADVTYDETAHPALVATFGELEELYPGVVIVIAATVRNEKTFEKFLKSCNGNGFVVQDIQFPVQKPEVQAGPFYTEGILIQLFCIMKKTTNVVI